MNKISELQTDKLVYNHIIYDSDAERHFAKHTHPLVEIIYVQSGAVAYTIENKKFVAKPGDLILIKPYAYHFFSVVGGTDYEKLGILFDESDIEVQSLTKEPFLLLPCDSGRIHEIFEKVDFYYQNCPQSIFKELLTSLAKEIILNVKLFHQQSLITVHRAIHPIIERALDYANDRLFTVSTVKEWAEALGVSDGYFKTLFTDEMKIPPKQYLTEKKMQMARSMILSGSSPTQTAFQCGYSNYVTFYRLYTKTFGVSPTDERKKM